MPSSIESFLKIGLAFRRDGTRKPVPVATVSQQHGAYLSSESISPANPIRPPRKTKQAEPVPETAHPPRWIEPRLTRLVEEAPAGTDWLHEVKYDGYAVMVIEWTIRPTSPRACDGGTYDRKVALLDAYHQAFHSHGKAVDGTNGLAPQPVNRAARIPGRAPTVAG
jgi:hypothetical protein